MIIASNPPCLNASSISPKVKAHIKTPDPKAIIAAIIFWLNFKVVPNITPRIKEKPVRNAYNKIFVVINKLCSNGFICNHMHRMAGNTEGFNNHHVSP
jgi:hypothetical protein